MTGELLGRRENRQVEKSIGPTTTVAGTLIILPSLDRQVEGPIGAGTTMVGTQIILPNLDRRVEGPTGSTTTIVGTLIILPRQGRLVEGPIGAATTTAGTPTILRDQDQQGREARQGEARRGANKMTIEVGTAEVVPPIFLHEVVGQGKVISLKIRIQEFEPST